MPLRLSNFPSITSLKDITTPASNPRRFLNSEINRVLTAYRKGKASKKELLETIDANRSELLADTPLDGNLLHELIRKGHTRSLLQVIIPNFPDAVLATETDVHSGQSVSLLRRAVVRKDRSMVDAIIKAIGFVLHVSVEDAPERREAMLKTLLKFDDWKLALLEYPSLLENEVVHQLFDLQPSDTKVISCTDDAADFRVNMSHDERKMLGSSTAFPTGFWVERVNEKNLTLFTREGLRLLYSPTRSRRHQTTLSHDQSAHFNFNCPLSPAGGEESVNGDNNSVLYHDITETSGAEVEAFFLAFPSALRPGDKSVLRLFCHLYEQTGKTWLFENDAVAAILDFKWKTFGRPIYIFLLVVNVLLALNYTFSSAYIMPLLESQSAIYRGLAWCWQIFILFNAFPLVLQEYFQLRSAGFSAYIRESQNYVDMVVLTLVYITIFWRFTLEKYYNVYHLLGGVASLLLWFKLVSFLRGLRETGPLVRMIGQILSDSKYFLLVLGISVVGFGTCLFMVFQIDLHREELEGVTDSPIATSYGTLYHTFLVLFAALNGNYDYTPFNSSSLHVFTSLIFVAYCAVNTIILLNLLIALMGDNYDRVQENTVAQGRYEQALSILQIESMLPHSLLEDDRFFPRWLQILKPKQTPAELEQWSGRIRQIYKKIDVAEKRLTTSITAVDERLESMEKRLGLAPTLLGHGSILSYSSIEDLANLANQVNSINNASRGGGSGQGHGGAAGYISRHTTNSSEAVIDESAGSGISAAALPLVKAKLFPEPKKPIAITPYIPTSSTNDSAGNQTPLRSLQALEESQKSHSKNSFAGRLNGGKEEGSQIGDGVGVDLLDDDDVEGGGRYNGEGEKEEEEEDDSSGDSDASIMVPPLDAELHRLLSNLTSGGGGGGLVVAGSSSSAGVVGPVSQSLPTTPRAYQEVHLRMTRLEEKMDEVLRLLLLQQTKQGGGSNSSDSSEEDPTEETPSLAFD